jgi:hypothetical protein
VPNLGVRLVQMSLGLAINITMTALRTYNDVRITGVQMQAINNNDADIIIITITIHPAATNCAYMPTALALLVIPNLSSSIPESASGLPCSKPMAGQQAKPPCMGGFGE